MLIVFFCNEFLMFDVSIVDFLDSAVKNFTTAAIKFHRSQDNIDFRE